VSPPILKGTTLKKLICGFIFILVLCGCSGCELQSINSIRKKYPDQKVYQIDDDEYIVFTNDKKFLYIITEFGNIKGIATLKEVIGYKDVF
jgi:hypothetical protein